MASSSKQKTTWSKIQRESRLRERRLDKAARKEARKNAPAEPDPTEVTMGEELQGESGFEDESIVEGESAAEQREDEALTDA